MAQQVKLSPAQEANVRTILKVAQQKGASPEVTLSAVEAAYVESNLQNLHSGDRDSLGIYQQRTPWGSTASRENVADSAGRYIDRAIAAHSSAPGGSAGQLAQRVQDSQYPARYDAARSIAKAIIGQYDDSGAGGTPSTSLATQVTGAEGGPSAQSASTPSLLSITTPVAPPATEIAPPAAAAKAQPSMPAAYPGVTPVGSPALLAPQTQMVANPLAQAADTSTGSDSSSSSEAPAASSSASTDQPLDLAAAKITINPGANRAGVGLTPGILHVLKVLSASTGEHIAVGTGTNHSKMTVDGNVSDHYSGNAVDIPAKGEQLTDKLVDSLLTFGQGKTVQWIKADGSATNVRITAANARTLAEHGGLFNIPYGDGNRRIQVIGNANSTAIGGDHTNHEHIGVTAL